jgi:hypothetical protein
LPKIKQVFHSTILCQHQLHRRHCKHPDGNIAWEDEAESITWMTGGVHITWQQIPAHQAPSSPTHISQLLVQMRVVSIGQNLTIFPLVLLVSTMTLSPQPQQPSFLGVLQESQLYIPHAQSAMAKTRGYLFQQQSDSQNAQFVPNTLHSQYQLGLRKQQDHRESCCIAYVRTTSWWHKYLYTKNDAITC